MFGREIIDRLRDGFDNKLRKEQAGFRRGQAGFRRGRSTVGQISILRNVIEQVTEWQLILYITFIDFKKALDYVHLENLRKIMVSYGIPDNIIRMVKILYEGSDCAMLDEGVETEWFK